MKKQILNLSVLITFAFLVGSCSKEEASSGAVNSGPFPTTNSPNSPNTAMNVQPTGCGTFYPMFKNSNYTFSVNGSMTDTIYGSFPGKDTTVDGKKYTILNSLQPSIGQTLGLIRREGGKLISYSYTTPSKFELIILDETKKVNEEWAGGQFVISNSGIEAVNSYTFKIVKQHANYTLSNGLKFNDVIEVNMKLKAETKLNGSVVGSTITDGGTQFYAKCVGVVRTFTPKNPSFGLNSDYIQEVKRYKM
ncbi:MAG: hypothetical protein ACK5UE_04440 [Chitinophagales bacterium]|nr:hypothetical protein [Sphingobacteriales bacterium]